MCERIVNRSCAKLLFFIVEYANLWPSCRYGYWSSLLWALRMYVLQIWLPAVPKQRRKMTRFDVSICWSRWPLHEAKQQNPGQLSLIIPFVILFSEVDFWWPFSVGEWRRCRISTSGAISHCCSLYTVTRRWSAGWSYEGLNIHLIPFPEGNFCSCAAI